MAQKALIAFCTVVQVVDDGPFWQTIAFLTQEQDMKLLM